MKTLVLIACLLTISYATDPEKVQKFLDIHAKCLEEMNEKDGYPPHVGKCMLVKYELVDEQGRIIKDKFLKEIEDLVDNNDEIKLRHAKELFDLCFNQANERSVSNDEKTLIFLNCAPTGLSQLYDIYK